MSSLKLIALPFKTSLNNKFLGQFLDSIYQCDQTLSILIHKFNLWIAHSLALLFVQTFPWYNLWTKYIWIAMALTREGFDWSQEHLDDTLLLTNILGDFDQKYIAQCWKSCPIDYKLTNVVTVIGIYKQRVEKFNNLLSGHAPIRLFNIPILPNWGSD